ncbi:MAG: hypothetical protein ACXQT1_05760 [Methermicoccaceae archaeon]
MRTLNSYPSYGGHNSLWYWVRVRSPLRVALNYVLMRLASVCPSLRLKGWIYRRMGVKLGEHVSVAFGVAHTPAHVCVYRYGHDGLRGGHSPPHTQL